MTLHFIDTNIFMYAIGSSHSFREPSQQLIRMIQEEKIKAIINVEILQEVLYRYHAINKAQIGYDLFEMLLQSFPVIWSVSKEDLLEAKKIQEKYNIKIRDAIHAATMKSNGITRLISTDKEFDHVDIVIRIDPMAYASIN